MACEAEPSVRREPREQKLIKKMNKIINKGRQES